VWIGAGMQPREKVHLASIAGESFFDLSSGGANLQSEVPRMAERIRVRNNQPGEGEH